MSADYVVIDGTGALISLPFFPYSKFFAFPPPPLFSFGQPSGLAYLLLTVKTGYSDPSENAAVLVNGTTIGTIDPRTWTNHFAVDLETIIFVFDSSVFFGFPPVQNLQIVPQGNLSDPSNFLLLGSAILHCRY
jgi:hypothetical protein